MKRAHALREAQTLIGGFSQPSKMPGLGYSLPATECKIGQLLARKSGTVCHGCYALKGRYMFPNVQAALHRRLASLRANPQQWADDIIRLLPYATDCRDFRWHDSGDIQGWEHLRQIVRIAYALPQFRFWLPTKEYALIRSWIKAHTPEGSILNLSSAFPPNLCVRISAPMLGDTTFHSVTGHVSYVAKDGANCPAPNQGGKCLDCRKCWDTSVPVVTYKLH